MQNLLDGSQPHFVYICPEYADSISEGKNNILYITINGYCGTSNFQKIEHTYNYPPILCVNEEILF